MASLVAKTVANNPYDFDALDKAYCDYYDSGSFDSGPTFEKVHELMANGYKRSEAVLETHKRLNGSTASATLCTDSPWSQDSTSHTKPSIA